MKIPSDLKHKPVIIAEEYAKVDGKYSGKTDVSGLSIGLAQWNDRGKVDISAKVWRHSGKRWSRQSEELPLHRVLDLAILIGKTKKYFSELYKDSTCAEKLYDEKTECIDKLEVQGERAKIEICKSNEMIDEDIVALRDALEKDDEFISERLHILADLLKEMGYGRNRK